MTVKTTTTSTIAPTVTGLPDCPGLWTDALGNVWLADLSTIQVIRIGGQWVTHAEPANAADFIGVCTPFHPATTDELE